MGEWYRTLQSMATALMAAQEVREGDWYEGNILYCGKCKEARRERITSHGEVLTVTRMCRCDREAEIAEEERKRKEEETLRLHENKQASGIEEMYRDARLSTFDVEADNTGAYNLAKNYIAQFPEMLSRNQGLLFWGDCGTGKTFTACVIGNELLEKGYTVYSISFAKMFQKVSGYSSEQEAELMEKVRTVDLLILDDLGTERTTEFANEKVYAVIDARYRSGKPTIFTTNMTLTQMKEAVDVRQKRLYDRIFQTCFPLQFNGDSRRLAEARERYKQMIILTKG